MKDRELLIKNEEHENLKSNNQILLIINIFLFLYLLSLFL